MYFLNIYTTVICVKQPFCSVMFGAVATGSDFHSVGLNSFRTQARFQQVHSDSDMFGTAKFSQVDCNYTQFPLFYVRMFCFEKRDIFLYQFGTKLVSILKHINILLINAVSSLKCGTFHDNSRFHCDTVWTCKLGSLCQKFRREKLIILFLFIFDLQQWVKTEGMAHGTYWVC